MEFTFYDIKIPNIPGVATSGWDDSLSTIVENLFHNAISYSDMYHLLQEADAASKEVDSARNIASTPIPNIPSFTI